MHADLRRVFIDEPGSENSSFEDEESDFIQAGVGASLAFRTAIPRGAPLFAVGPPRGTSRQDTPMKAPVKTLVPALALALAAGCAAPPPPAPPPGVPTTRETVESLGSMLATARSRLQSAVAKLGRVVESPEGDLAADAGAFAHELRALEGDVDWVRRAALHMAIRSDIYLELWFRKTAGAAAPEVREQAERRRAQLTADFMDLKGRSDAVRQAFAPLLSRLQDCARFLGGEPTRRAAGSLSGELRTIRGLEAEALTRLEEYRMTMAAIHAKIPAGD